MPTNAKQYYQIATQGPPIDIDIKGLILFIGVPTEHIFKTTQDTFQLSFNRTYYLPSLLSTLKMQLSSIVTIMAFLLSSNVLAAPSVASPGRSIARLLCNSVSLEAYGNLQEIRSIGAHVIAPAAGIATITAPMDLAQILSDKVYVS